LRRHFQTDALPLLFKKRLGVFKTQGAGELRVVAEDRMHIKREMRAVERNVVLEGALKHPPPTTGNWLQAGPEQAVMHNQEVHLAFDCRVDRARGCVDRSANLCYIAGIFDLQTIQRIRPVADFADPQEVVAVFDQLTELWHARFYFTGLRLNSCFLQRSLVMLSEVETSPPKASVSEKSGEALWSLLDEIFAPCDREASAIPDLTTENSLGIY
jgi:hypothetical protein